MDFLNSIIHFFQQGGFFMYPIALTVAIGWAIALERYIFLSRARSVNRKTWDGLQPVLRQGNFQKIQQQLTDSEVAIARILHLGLSRIRGGRPREDIETAMEEGLMEVVPGLEKRTHYLATFANVVMLLGLLGTVSGLIEAFAAVANAEPAKKAELLSASIAVGMNCTAFGLGSAIPLMLMYSFLQSKTTELVDSLEMAPVKFPNMLNDLPQPQRSGA